MLQCYWTEGFFRSTCFKGGKDSIHPPVVNFSSHQVALQLPFSLLFRSVSTGHPQKTTRPPATALHFCQECPQGDWPSVSEVIRGPSLPVSWRSSGLGMIQVGHRRWPGQKVLSSKQWQPQPVGQTSWVRNHSIMWLVWPPWPQVRQKLEEPRTATWQMAHWKAKPLQMAH